VDEAKKKEMQPLLDYMQGKLAEVKEVRLSARLKESAAVLVSDEDAPSLLMERLMQQMGKVIPPAKRILEINADHPAIQAMRQRLERDAKDARLEDYCHLLYDQAVIAEGSKVNDPVAFARRVNELLVKDAAG
jgi:molecular chaperone HtpG